MDFRSGIGDGDGGGYVPGDPVKGGVVS